MRPSALRTTLPNQIIQYHPAEFSAAAGIVSLAGGGCESFCARVGDGFAGAWGRDGSAGISAEESDRPEADCGVQGGCGEVWMGQREVNVRARDSASPAVRTRAAIVATCAEVAVDPATKKVRIRRVVQAWESGAIVNPDGLRNQISGAIVQGIGGALFEQILFADGRIQNASFAQYRLPRFSDAPQIEVVLLDRKDLPSAGAGETGIVDLRRRWAMRFLRRRARASAACPWRRKRLRRDRRSRCSKADSPP